MSITDGNGGIQHFPPIQDYKRLCNNDFRGPNTGGMGCVIDKNNTLPFLNKKDIELCESINNKVIRELNKLSKNNNSKIG